MFSAPLILLNRDGADRLAHRCRRGAGRHRGRPPDPALSRRRPFRRALPPPAAHARGDPRASRRRRCERQYGRQQGRNGRPGRQGRGGGLPGQRVPRLGLIDSAPHRVGQARGPPGPTPSRTPSLQAPDVRRRRSRARCRHLHDGSEDRAIAPSTTAPAAWADRPLRSGPSSSWSSSSSSPGCIPTPTSTTRSQSAPPPPRRTRVPGSTIMERPRRRRAHRAARSRRRRRRRRTRRPTRSPMPLTR